MLNPFDVLLKAALSRFQDKNAERLFEANPAAFRRQALMKLSLLFAAACILVGFCLYRVGSVAYQLSNPQIVGGHGKLDPTEDDPSKDPVPPDEPTPPVLTPEQKRIQEEEAALAQLSAETGFSSALVSQLFKSPEELAKLEVIKDLRERYDLDVEGERYLLNLMDTIGERLIMLRISSDNHQYVFSKIVGFADRITGDVQRGGPFADAKLRERRAALVEGNRGALDVLISLFRNQNGASIPAIDPRPIADAITNHRPIRRLDIVRIIVLPRHAGLSHKRGPFC